MSNQNNPISEFNSLEQISQRDTMLNERYPLFKLIITVFYLVAVMTCDKHDVTRLLLMSVYPIIMFGIGDLSYRHAFRRLRRILPLILIMGIANPFLERNMAGSLCGIPITEGMISFLTLIMKGILAVLAGYILIASTGIDSLCFALRRLHVPTLPVTVFLLTYRYISLLMKETSALFSSYRLRSGGQKGISIAFWGSFVGNLLLRSMDRAAEIHQSMCLRGFDGDNYFQKKVYPKKSDYVFLILSLVLIIIFRKVQFL